MRKIIAFRCHDQRRFSKAGMINKNILMKFSGFLKTPQHKRFHLHLRYWDPAKEEREEREQRIKTELGIADEKAEFRPNVRGKISGKIRHKYSETSSIRKKSNFRLVVIFAMLALLAYFILGENELLERLISVLGTSNH